MAEKIPTAAELIVITKTAAGLRAQSESGTFASIAGTEVAGLNKILKNTAITPLFGVSEERTIAAAAQEAASTGLKLPDLSVFYQVELPATEKAAAELVAKLNEHEAVEAAYIKPGAEPAQLNQMAALPQDAPPATPDFSASQIYLGAAAGGIEALWAHGRPGGKGNNIRVIDIEGAWRFSHEDLGANQGGVVGGFQSSNLGWRNHGTAVIGVISGDENAIGIKGIAPNANMRAISIFTNAAGTTANSANAIRAAADLLSAGDIILIELHRPGPRHAFASRADQAGYIAIEWWEDDFQAIRYAATKGVIVVEAAGNGQENLDDPIYSVRPAGFPAAWTNPFNRSNRDSSAIVVGAGAPPPGTHGRDHGPDRSRLGFSNYGALVDAQGWGREVTTAGYGDLQGGGNENVWYTEQFSGTSSASPIVVGAVACLQGIRRAGGQAVLTPAQMRSRLRSTGSAQTDAPGRPASQRIGNRPNIRQLVGRVIKAKHEKIEIKEIKFEKVEKIEVKENRKVEFEKIRDVIKQREVIDPIRIHPGSASIEDRLAAIEAALGLSTRGPGGGDGGFPEEADAPQIPVPQQVCTAFGSMPVGQGPNPRAGNQAAFRVFLANGTPAPVTNILVSGGVRGLDCRFRTVVTLAQPASSVSIALVHFAGPGTIAAYNAANALVASVATAAAPGVQSRVLNGPGIVRVVINCPTNRTLLVRFCYRRIFKIKPEKEAKLEKVEKVEKVEIKEQGKEQFKEQFKEVKEQGKEFKEIKEGIKEVKEFKEGKEFEGGPPPSHFIDAELRPDLGAGALTGEDDLDEWANDAGAYDAGANDAGANDPWASDPLSGDAWSGDADKDFADKLSDV